MRVGRGAPPTPDGAATVDEVVRRLRELRTWAGLSEREVHRRVGRRRAARGTVEVPAFDTVRRCFAPGRKRLDVDLVVDIASVLLDGEAVRWRSALQLIAGWSAEATAVRTFDRLPVDLAGFSGRRAELRLLDSLADGGPVIAVAGMPGVGKTTLVNRFAHRVAARYPGPVLWADLRGHDPALPQADPGAVLDGFLRHLGVATGRGAAVSRYRDRLRGTRAVVVLDDAASEEQVTPLLPLGTGCLTLITSRSSLPLADSHHLALDVFSDREAVEFLGRAVGVGRVEAESGAAARIAETAGYLPLTLGLVAGRITATADWTLADHLDRLLLRHGGLRLDDRIETEFGRSYRALPAELQRAFRLLALHPGRDFDAYAAAALTGTDLDGVRRHLDVLVVRNLLQQHVAGRFRYHDLLRTYASAQAVEHDPSAVRRAAQERVLDHYRHTAASAMDRYAPYEDHPRGPAPGFAGRKDATAWLDAERANLAACSAHAARQHAYDYCDEVSGLLTQYLEGGCHYRDAEVLHSQACRSPDPRVRAHALRRVSVVHWKTGRYTTALDQLRTALTLFRGCGDRAGEGKTLNNLGTVYRRLGRHRQASRCHPPAIAIAARLGDRDAEANARNCLGLLYLRLGRHADAEAEQRRAMAVFRDIGNQAGLGRVWADLGDVHRHAGRHTEALWCYPQAMIVAQDVGDRVGLGLALARAGLLQADLGFHQAAGDSLERARRIAEETGDCGVELETLHGLGVALERRGDPEQALTYHRDALATATTLGARHEQALAHDAIATCLTRLGTPETALHSPPPP